MLITTVIRLPVPKDADCSKLLLQRVRLRPPGRVHLLPPPRAISQRLINLMEKGSAHTETTAEMALFVQGRPFRPPKVVRHDKHRNPRQNRRLHCENDIKRASAAPRAPHTYNAATQRARIAKRKSRAYREHVAHGEVVLGRGHDRFDDSPGEKDGRHSIAR